jgi:CDP-diacylglycerol---serine O-phosphatidyltransferase
MKRQVVLPNLLTACSLFCGLFVIFKMNMIQPGTAVFSQVQICVQILILAAVFDALDGALARVIRAESEFGGFFDSMADAVSFGVAPSVVVLKTLSVIPGSVLSFFLTLGAMTYSVAGVLRLVRFSTTPLSDDPEKKATFTGLPITGAALAALSPTLLLMSETWQAHFPTSDFVRAIVAICVFSLLGYLMVSRWRFASLKAINVKVVSPYLLFVIAIFASLVLFSILESFPVGLLLISWGYVIPAWIYAIIHLVQGRRKAALDETDEDIDQSHE